MKEPKLFYVPINFLDKNLNKEIPDNHYKDFAVIEVEFWTEGYAEQATGNFYGKYGEGLNPKKPLNLFEDGTKIEKKEELEEGPSDRFYSLGYEKSKAFEASFSYEEDIAKTSKLAKDVEGLSDDQGRVSAAMIDNSKDAERVRTNWYGKELKRIGHFYMLDYFAMEGGVSGSLVVDGNQNILGLKSVGNLETDKSYIVPLRSKAVDHGSYKTPEYDLIEGVAGQLSSYKQQLQRYVLNDETETWLSKMRGWKQDLKS